MGELRMENNASPAIFPVLVNLQSGLILWSEFSVVYWLHMLMYFNQRKDHFMKTICATEAKRNISKLFTDIKAEPVIIQRYGKDHTVALSPEEYNLLTAGAVKANYTD